jgi:hypothetical protein
MKDADIAPPALLAEALPAQHLVPGGHALAQRPQHAPPSSGELVHQQRLERPLEERQVVHENPAPWHVGPRNELAGEEEEGASHDPPGWPRSPPRSPAAAAAKHATTELAVYRTSQMTRTK